MMAGALTIHVYGRGDHFGHVTQMPGIPFVPLHIKFFLIRQAVLEENLFEMVDGQTPTNAGLWVYYRLAW